MSEMLTPKLLLRGYARGIFPMAETREDTELFWVDPAMRGVIPLDGFHISRSLAKKLRKGGFEGRNDTAFDQVVEACADREETWINGPLFRLYGALHADGYAHSQEIWADGRLIGGVFGIALGGAFFGESMFSHAPDGSKLALAFLVHRLREGGFALFDTQFLTSHLASLGAVEIPRRDYKDMLDAALKQSGNWSFAGDPAPQVVLQRSTQTS